MNFTINVTRDYVNQSDSLNLLTLYGYGSVQDITTVNGSEFWLIDSVNKSVIHIKRSGELITRYSLVAKASTGIRGITTVNGSEFWIADTNPDAILHYDSAFNYINNFSTSAFGSQTASGITTVNGSEFWIVDSQNDTVFHVNSAGMLLAS